MELTGTFPLNSIFTSSCLMAASLSWSISRSTSSSICRTCRVWENLKINSNVWSQSTDKKAMYCILIYSWNTTEGELAVNLTQGSYLGHPFLYHHQRETVNNEQTKISNISIKADKIIVFIVSHASSKILLQYQR